MTIKATAALYAAAVAGLGLPAAAATVTSTFAVPNGNWENAASWTEAPANANYPNNFGATTFDAVIPAGNATLGASVTIQKFTLTSGSLSGAGTVTAKETFTWGLGSLSGSNTINADGGISIATAGNRLFQGGTINVKAGTTANWLLGNVQGEFGAVFNNAGTFAIQTDGNLLGSGTGRTALNNPGVITKSAGTGTTNIAWALNNTGTVSATVGTLRMSGGGTSTGTFTGAALTTLDFAGTVGTTNGATLLPGSKVIADKVIFSGGGFTHVQGAYNVATSTTIDAPTYFESAVTSVGATLTANNGIAGFDHPAPFSTGTINIAGGSLRVAGPVTASTLVNWTSGAFTGAGTVTASSTLAISGTNSKNFSGSLTNAGTGTWSGGNLNGSGAILTNTGTFNVDGDVTYAYSGTEPHLVNSGTFTKTSGAGVADIQAILHNTGTVSATIGTLRFSMGGTSSGRVAGLGTVEFGAQSGGRAYDLTPTSSVTAANVRIQPNAIVTANGSYGALHTAVSGGVLEIFGPQAYPAGATFDVTSGAVHLNTDAGAPAAANLTVNATGGDIYPNATQHFAGLALSTSARLLTPTVTPGTHTVVARSLAITGNAEFDLNTNQLVYDYTGPAGPALATVRNAIISGANTNAVAWTGPGIRSTAARNTPGTAIGYGEATDILGIAPGGTATWLGNTVDGTSVLARYTKYADATLDGAVDFLDLVKVAQNYNVIDGTRTWATGDFTYDGNVDFLDLVKLAQNYNTALPTAAIPGAPADFQADLAAAFATVPEPGALCLVAIAACGWTARRRRSRA